MSHLYYHDSLHTHSGLQYPLEVVTEPTTPAVSLTDAKEFLREDRSVEDSLIESLVDAAESVLEQHTGYNLIDTVYQMHIHSFRDIYIPKKPFKAGSVSIVYDDADGAEQTLASSKYTVYSQENPVRIHFEENQPTLYDDNDYPIRINFTVGYGTSASSVPRN